MIIDATFNEVDEKIEADFSSLVKLDSTPEWNGSHTITEGGDE